MKSGITRVTYYQATPVKTCDRCNQGIKHVFVVIYRDGVTEQYGSECINKVLAGDTSLKSLFTKNTKLLQKYQRALAAITLPDTEMPLGSEYYGSSLHFIADNTGEDIMFDGHYLFHPLFDAKKNAEGGKYVTDPHAHLIRTHRDIEKGKVFLQKEIIRIEGFLARVLAKAAAKDSANINPVGVSA